MNQRIEKKKTIDDGKRYALSIGFPLIIKPNNLSQGV
jgi:biotin carboxylase